MPLTVLYLVKGDSSFDGALVFHCLKAFLPLFKLECLVNDTLHLDFAAVEVVDSCWKLVNFTEGAKNSDFIADWTWLVFNHLRKPAHEVKHTNLAWRP